MKTIAKIEINTFEIQRKGGRGGKALWQICADEKPTEIQRKLPRRGYAVWLLRKLYYCASMRGLREATVELALIPSPSKSRLRDSGQQFVLLQEKKIETK